MLLFPLLCLATSHLFTWKIVVFIFMLNEDLCYFFYCLSPSLTVGGSIPVVVQDSKSHIQPDPIQLKLHAGKGGGGAGILSSHPTATVPPLMGGGGAPAGMAGSIPLSPSFSMYLSPSFSMYLFTSSCLYLLVIAGMYIHYVEKSYIYIICTKRCLIILRPHFFCRDVNI